MMTTRDRRKYWLLAKLAAIVCLGILVLTPKDIDLSAITGFNPLVTQAQAAGL